MRARNGARIIFRSMMARVRATCASATSRWASASSSSVSRHGTALVQPPRALEERFRERRLRFLRAQLRTFDRDVERDEHGAGLDDAARREVYAPHRAWQLVAQRHRALRDNRAYRCRRRRIRALPRGGNHDGFHRLGLICGRVRGIHDGGDLPRGQSAGRQQQRDDQDRGAVPDLFQHGEHQFRSLLGTTIRRVPGQANLHGDSLAVSQKG